MDARVHRPLSSAQTPGPLPIGQAGSPHRVSLGSPISIVSLQVIPRLSQYLPLISLSLAAASSVWRLVQTPGSLSLIALCVAGYAGIVTGYALGGWCEEPSPSTPASPSETETLGATPVFLLPRLRPTAPTPGRNFRESTRQLG